MTYMYSCNVEVILGLGLFCVSEWVCRGKGVARVTFFLALEKQPSWQCVGGGSPGLGLAWLKPRSLTVD